MIEVVGIGLAYLAGVEWRRLALLGAAVWAPLPLTAVVALVVARCREPVDERAPLFCDAVAAELRAGSSLGSALHSAASSVGLALPGPAGTASALEVATVAARELEDIGQELVAAVEAVVGSGGRAADLFEELAALAITHIEIAHEVRVSSAPARATAWFLVLAPSVFVSVQAAAGGLDGLFDAPAQRLAALTGGVLFLLGLGAVIVLLTRAR